MAIEWEGGSRDTGAADFRIQPKGAIDNSGFGRRAGLPPPPDDSALPTARPGAYATDRMYRDDLRLDSSSDVPNVTEAEVPAPKYDYAALFARMDPDKSFQTIEVEPGVELELTRSRDFIGVEAVLPLEDSNVVVVPVLQAAVPDREAGPEDDENYFDAYDHEAIDRLMPGSRVMVANLYTQTGREEYPDILQHFHARDFMAFAIDHLGSSEEGPVTHVYAKFEEGTNFDVIEEQMAIGNTDAEAVPQTWTAQTLESHGFSYMDRSLRTESIYNNSTLLPQLQTMHTAIFFRPPQEQLPQQ